MNISNVDHKWNKWGVMSIFDALSSVYNNSNNKSLDGKKEESPFVFMSCAWVH